MEILLLGIYSFFVWLIFFKFKWLPWTTAVAVVVITLPILGLSAMMLLLNVYAPSAKEVQVLKYVVQVLPRVTGRVTDVPVEPNRLIHKGDVLFKIDARPFEYEVNRLEAVLASTSANVQSQREDLRAANAQIDVARNRAVAIQASIEAARVRLKLGELRVQQTTELANAGAGDKFEAERWENDVAQTRADIGALLPQLSAAQQEITAYQAKSASLRERIGAKSGNQQADVAQIQAQLDDAKWKLGETTAYAPEDGYVVNLQLRPGATAAQMPMLPVMTLVEQEYVILAMFDQNELHQVQPGNEAEIALSTYPGRIIKCKVDSIVWAQGQGQLPMTGTLPQTGSVPLPEGRFPVKLVLDERERGLELAAGAKGIGAIYTEHLTPIHLVRKVLLRVSSKLDWVIIKHGIPFGH
jgi:multidrug resistance efflux pump